MICVRLAGGLGNQIFQLAAALRLRKGSLEHIALYTEGLSDYAVSRSFELEKLFDLSCLDVSIDDFSRIQKYVIQARVGRWPILGCSDSNYHKHLTLPTRSKNLFVDGYFQGVWDKRSFEDICKILSLALRPGADRLPRSLIIHIRGGDFKNIPNLNICSFDWYAKALSLALAKNPDISCISVLSEDQLYAHDLVMFLSGKFDKDIVLKPNQSAIDDFQYLMSQENLVIGNSTFSFWASALNAVSKTCIAPSHFSSDVKRPPFIASETLLDI